MQYDHYVIALLEQIAWNTSGQTVEKHDYLERIKFYAGDIEGPTEILRDVRALAAARQWEVPGHESGKDVGVRQHADTGVTKPGLQNKIRDWLPKK